MSKDNLHNKLRERAILLRFFSIVILLLIGGVLIGAYLIFTSTTLDRTSYLTSALKKELLIENKKSDAIYNKLINIDDSVFGKLEKENFKIASYNVSYIKKMRNLSGEASVQFERNIRKYYDNKENFISIIMDNEKIRENNAINPNKYTKLKDVPNLKTVSELIEESDLDKEIKEELLYLDINFILRVNNNIFLFMGRINKFNSNYNRNQYTSKFYHAYKNLVEEDKNKTGYYSLYSLRRNIVNNEEFKDINKSLSNEYNNFNTHIKETALGFEKLLMLIKEKRNKYKSEIKTEENFISENQYHIYNAIAIKITITVFLLFLLKLFVDTFKYLLRLSSSYERKADMLEYIKYNENVNYNILTDIFSYEKIDFSKDKSSNIDDVKKLLEISNRT